MNEEKCTGTFALTVAVILIRGERCDCREEREREREKVTKISKFLKVETNGQMKIKFEEVV